MKYSLILICLLALARLSVQGQSAAELAPETDSLRHALQAMELSKTVKIREIHFHGNDITRRSVLLREMGLYEGEIILTDSIPGLMWQDRLRLLNLTLFNEIDMHVEKLSAYEVDLHIHVKERWFIIPELSFQLADRNFNQWWVEQHHDINRINLMLAAEDKNFRGTLETLTAYAQIGYTQKLMLNYMRPYIDKAQKSGIGFSVSYATNRQLFYTTDSNKQVYAGTYTGPVLSHQFEGALIYSYRPAYAVKHFFRAGYKDYTVADTIRQLNKDYFSDSSRKAKMLEFVYRFELNKADNWDYALTGFKMVVNATSRIGFEGLKNQNILVVEAGIYNNPFRKWYFDAIFRGRLMFPERQPYALEEGLGFQSNFVRGYEYYVINGSHYGILHLDLKRELVNHTFKGIPVKYFSAIPLRFYPKVFADLGYIRQIDAGNSFLSNRLLYSAGIGCDIITVYDFKIRLEFAYNHLMQKGLYLHTTSE